MKITGAICIGFGSDIPEFIDRWHMTLLLTLSLVASANSMKCLNSLFYDPDH